MKILFDANTPAPLARFLAGHKVTRADQLGWQAIENGELLAAAEQAGFDILLTCDQNVQYQQNLTGLRVALVVLSSNHWPTLQTVGPRISSIVESVRAGQIVNIDIRSL